MSPRTLPRVLVVATTLAVTVLATAIPALAREQDAGSEPGEPLSPLATLLIFGVLPVAMFLFIALLVSAGSIARGPRYRPDRAWEAGPATFGLPEHGVRPATEAIEARPGAQPAGGEPADSDDPGGGVSGRW